MKHVAGRISRAFRTNFAETSLDAEDPRLRGRTYAVPIEEVWQAARSLASGGLPGWRIRSSDDLAGIINAQAKNILRRSPDDVRIRISLDEDAQTRVDARSGSRDGRADLGMNARRLVRFFRALDQLVAERWNSRERVSRA
jgi:hypothetical protein